MLLRSHCALDRFLRHIKEKVAQTVALATGK